MTFEAILKDLKNKVYYPVYFLHGEESYYIDKIADYIEENVLTESEKEFNQSVLYGKETDVSTIVGSAKRFPMMSNYQVIIVKEAQEVRNLIAKDKDKDELLFYLENPLKSTILVFCYKYKEIDKRTKLAKVIEKKSVLFESKKIYENKVPDWIVSYLNAKAYHINPQATSLLTEYLGNDLSKVANELDKLMLNVKSNEEITVKHIEDNIGISKDFNIFELQNALGKKNILKANLIAKYFKANTKVNPLVVTIASLYSYFSKILIYHSLSDKSRNNVASALKVNPFFVSDYETTAKNYSLSKTIDIISYLREYDLKSKGVDSTGIEEGDLLRELVFKILH